MRGNTEVLGSKGQRWPGADAEEAVHPTGFPGCRESIRAVGLPGASKHLPPGLVAMRALRGATASHAEYPRQVA